MTTISSTILSQVLARAKTTTTLDNLFEQEYKQRIIEFTEDPLVLSCTLHSLRSAGSPWMNIDSDIVKESVSIEHREEAEKIRDYYTKKFFWSALANTRPLSDYRRRLLNLLESRIRKCDDKDVGIYYKLPFFYKEDIVYDQLKKNFKTVSLPAITNNNSKVRMDLTFISTTFSSQRKNKIERFWFTEGTYLYQIEIRDDNPLMDLFKSLLSDNKVLKLETHRYIDRIDNMEFYKLLKFNLVKE